MTLRVCVDGDVIGRNGGWRFIQQKYFRCFVGKVIQSMFLKKDVGSLQR